MQKIPMSNRAKRQLQVETVVSYPKAAGGWARLKVIRSQLPGTRSK